MRKIDHDVIHDRAYANGMRAVLRAVWPYVGESDDALAIVLKTLDASADRLSDAAREMSKQLSI